jgi:hypothetical protein
MATHSHTFAFGFSFYLMNVKVLVLIPNHDFMSSFLIMCNCFLVTIFCYLYYSVDLFCTVFYIFNMSVDLFMHSFSAVFIFWYDWIISTCCIVKKVESDICSCCGFESHVSSVVCIVITHRLCGTTQMN